MNLPDSRELSKAQGDCQRLEREVLELRQDLETCRAEAREFAEHANMAKFQNQLLLDMVRSSRHMVYSNYSTTVNMLQ